MDNEKKPTPTPWVTNDETDYTILIVKPWGQDFRPEQSSGYGDYRGCYVAKLEHQNDNPCVSKDTAQANAELIVRAVNSYEPMQARIKEMEKAVTMVLHCLRDGIPVEKDDPIHQTLSRVFPELLQSSKQL